MIEILSAQMEEAKERLTLWQQLRPQLPAAEEKLAEKRYELQAIEDFLAEADEEIQRLESVSLASMMDALLGRRYGKLADKREEAAALKLEHDECLESIASAGEAVQAIEQQLGELNDAGERYQALCEEKLRLIIEAGGDGAAELSELSTRFDLAKGERHKLQTLVNTGRQLLDRMHAMTKSAGRARGKSVSMYVLGVIPAMATIAITAQSAWGAVNRARDGVERFHRALGELDLSAGTQSDIEIMRLITVLEGCCGDLSLRSAVSDIGSTWPIVDAVQEVIGHLKDKSKEVDQFVADLDQQHRAMTETL